jgi:hypothetical protein
MIRRFSPALAGLGYGGEGFCSFTIASPTGEGMTNPVSFSRIRRCTLKDAFRADGLGGKGIVLFSGLVSNVEAAVELGKEALERPELLVRAVVIPQLHPGMWENVGETTWFGTRVRSKP